MANSKTHLEYVEFLKYLARTSPIVFCIILIMNCIINYNKNSIYLLIMYCIVVISNTFLKCCVFKPLYSFFNKDKLPLLGLGSRPKPNNPKKSNLHCDFNFSFNICEKNNTNNTNNTTTTKNSISTDYIKTSLSFGMPSGHSQIAWFISTYLICKIINHMYKNKIYSRNSNSNSSNSSNSNSSNSNSSNSNSNTIIKTLLYFLSIIILLIISTYISYGRVYIENCHTIQQVIIGGIIGCICGFLIYYYEDKIIKLFS